MEAVTVSCRSYRSWVGWEMDFAIDMSHLTVLLVRCCATRLFSRRKD